MSQYDIHYRCGHTLVEQIYGTNVRGERETEKARREQKLCRDCYRDQQRQDAHNATAHLELPELSGSPKQVAWADDIRRKTLAALDDGEDRAVTTAKELTTAKWWIDHSSSGLAVVALRAEIPRTEDEKMQAEEDARQLRTDGTRLALHTEQFIERRDPDHRRGQPRKVLLNAEPARALRVYNHAVNDTTDSTRYRSNNDPDGISQRGLDRQVLQQWIAANTETAQVAVELVTLALTRADETGAPADRARAEWAVAQELEERHRQSQPAPAPREIGQCQHGVSFAEACDDCGI